MSESSLSKPLSVDQDRFSTLSILMVGMNVKAGSIYSNFPCTESTSW